jgi:hypothetical protein
MSRYSIQKKGCEYVVLADDQSILTFTSRRKAAKFVAEASELLSVQSALPAAAEERGGDQSPVKAAKFLDDEVRFP